MLWGTGKPSREFLYVDDAARALLLAAERLDGSDPVNIGTGIETSIRDAGGDDRAARRATRARSCGTRRGPTASRRRYLDVSRARELMGFEARRPARGRPARDDRELPRAAHRARHERAPRAHHRRRRPGRLVPGRAPARPAATRSSGSCAARRTRRYREPRRRSSDDIRLLQGDLLDQMTLLDAITRAEPDELYNLAATSFVPASWRQPVMTAQFTAVGVTSMLEAVRITKPDLRVYQASTSEIFGATTESPQSESTPFAPAQPLRGRQALRPSHGRRPTASATACTRAQRDPLQPRVAAPAAGVRHAQGHARPPRRSSSACRTSCALGDLDATPRLELRRRRRRGDVAHAPAGRGRRLRRLQRREPDRSASSSQTAFGRVGLTPTTTSSSTREFVRPPDPVSLVGDPSKARERSSAGSRGRASRTSSAMMVEARPAAARREPRLRERSRALRPAGHAGPADYHRRHAVPQRGGHDRGDAAQRPRRRTIAALEHVVVDGGSTDGTRRRSSSAADGRPLRVRARPRAVARDEQGHRTWPATTIVGWLNADDVYLPGALRAVGEAFAARPDAEWATGRCLIIDGDGSEIRRGATALQERAPAALLASRCS